MISLPTDVLDLLDSGRMAVRGLMRFQFGTGTYGFWTGSEPLTWNGLTYVPTGLLDVSPVSRSVGLAAQKVDIRLAERPESGLTADVLAQVEQEDWYGRPVTLWNALIHPDTRAILHTRIRWQGVVDTLDHEMNGSVMELVARCETHAIDHASNLQRLRNHADQQIISPGDRGLEYVVPGATAKIYWGRTGA